MNVAGDDQAHMAIDSGAGIPTRCRLSLGIRAHCQEIGICRPAPKSHVWRQLVDE
jgi:hypothetical protein